MSCDPFAVTGVYVEWSLAETRKENILKVSTGGTIKCLICSVDRYTSMLPQVKETLSPRKPNKRYEVSIFVMLRLTDCSVSDGAGWGHLTPLATASPPTSQSSCRQLQRQLGHCVTPHTHTRSHTFLSSSQSSHMSSLSLQQTEFFCFTLAFSFFSALKRVWPSHHSLMFDGVFYHHFPLQVCTSCDITTPCRRGHGTAARDHLATQVRRWGWFTLVTFWI